VIVLEVVVPPLGSRTLWEIFWRRICLRESIHIGGLFARAGDLDEPVHGRAHDCPLLRRQHGGHLAQVDRGAVMGR